MPESPDAPLSAYRRKRDFAATAEPAPSDNVSKKGGALFVVQKHSARRAGLHYDFRLEHGGVLWSWAVPKGPSLDPHDRRMAIHVEDHPVEYAAFQGAIPEGQYGAGEVETWDRGTWQPLDDDPDEALRQGKLHFVLQGSLLRGRFTLARLGGRDKRRSDGWFLIKGHDEHAREGLGAAELEQQTVLQTRGPSEAPAQGAVRGALPEQQKPQLCTLVEQAPEGDGWLSEIKFDGYRILAAVDDGPEGRRVRLLTRNGLDWAERMPALAAAVAALPAAAAMLDGELVALDAAGASSFPGLQAALKAGHDGTLVFYAFDLLHLDGWDLRPSALIDRKAALRGLVNEQGTVRYSDHAVGDAAALHANACRMGLEGIVAKRAQDPYRPGRGPGWVKVKCLGREEFIVLGWTPPSGSRAGLGALQLGYFDPDGRLHYAGGVGTGFSDKVLRDLRAKLDGMAAPAPELLVSGDPVDKAITWVWPELVAEVKYTAWSGAGRIRHPVFLGLREDKPARDVVREAADPDAPRLPLRLSRRGVGRGWHGAVPPKPAAVSARTATAAKGARIVTAKAPQKPKLRLGAVELSHPDRALWPGISKQDLAEYWQAMAAWALPGLAHRPLSILRCPDGIGGEQFFQKNGHSHLPAPIREGRVGSQPFLAIDDADGLVAMAQMSAIELHAWGAAESDPSRPDRMVFDLDPGEGVPFKEVAAAARLVRDRLAALGLRSFCRTTGGKGLHVVVPLRPEAGWDRVKPFCRAFADMLAEEQPKRFLAHLKIADRTGRILIDWLRNGLGSTAVASYSPRARPGAGVATPLAWSEVTARLDPARFTLLTVPARMTKLKEDPWAEWASIDQVLPDLAPPKAAKPPAPPRPASRPAPRIVTARKPKPRS